MLVEKSSSKNIGYLTMLMMVLLGLLILIGVFILGPIQSLLK